MSQREYKINIDPRILELLGPSLYTNIYYVLAELIANAYDADAKNVYIIANKDDITVEDDGKGMSYSKGDINKYLNVAAVSRNTEDEAYTKEFKRKKMGRKGVGKLAALSVSENVQIKTIAYGEKSGFVLSRHINKDNLLIPINEDDIKGEKITQGTAVVMQNPQYRLHNTLKAVKRNLLKIFPLVDKNFKIHLIRGSETDIIENFDKEMMGELSTLIILGEEFSYLSNYWRTDFKEKRNELIKNKSTYSTPVTMKDKHDQEHQYNVEIKGWIGTYLTTRGRKVELTDFPDNFVSLYANRKMGEFNILPVVGQNKLQEVYVVGQLHIDIFELTELPDMALSNRQGYKSDDPRYQSVLKYVREDLLPSILKMRDIFVDLKNKNSEQDKLKKQLDKEKELKQKVDNFRDKTSKRASQKISEKFGIPAEGVKGIVEDAINENNPELGIKNIIDIQKKKILISQTLKDKDLSDVVYNMLIFNSVSPEDIIYTNCDDEIARIPEGVSIYKYLRDFFVNSYSTQKIYAIFITSHESKSKWGAVAEVGAAWITEIEHKIFNVVDFRPEHPLDDEVEWHNSYREDTKLAMSRLEADKFAVKIENVCDKLGYTKRTRKENINKLETLVKVV
ncbi:MAG: ATP-binding protein [Endomicrobium sp.]|jgi:hypothetical protein|nr:ATP-binding protein [Endomicrobium sp.]